MMDREQLDAMTDDELRVKAAEMYLGSIAVYGDICMIPDYPNDIAAAWVLLDELIDRRHEPVIETYKRKEDGARMYQIEICIDRAQDDGIDYITIKYSDSAPKAITKAFIMAMEAK